MVAEFLAAMPGGAHGAVFVVMVIVFILGMFLDTFEILFIVVPISAPILLKMDVDPVWLSIMLAINLQTSYLTPPFGFSLFFLRGVAPPEVTTGHIYRGIVPFVGLQIIALAIVWIIPAARDLAADGDLRKVAASRSQKNASVRISMLSRGRAFGGEVGSSKAVCALQRARPSFSES